MLDSYDTAATLDGARIVDLRAFAERFPSVRTMPVARRILVENLLRAEDGVSVTAEDIQAVATAPARPERETEIAFRPSRVVMQDYAGMPALIDLAALRDRAAEAGVSPESVNPQIPADLVVDHSVMVHYARTEDAYRRNLAREFEDNRERFAFLKWAQSAMKGLRVVPPGQGIIHQVNIEYLAEVVSRREVVGEDWMFPDTVIGTDSHTTMVNGLGVLGWGVGGIEAEAVMLGEPVSMLVPPVVGVRLDGAMPAGVLATDLVLTLTEILRGHGVVGAILEFFGPGVSALSVADRATIANMSPEFGSTAAFFPTDDRTLEYLRLTGRSNDHITQVERYLRRNDLWFDAELVPDVADLIEIDLSRVRRAVAGPKRPEERRDLADVPTAMRSVAEGAATGPRLSDGDIVIAAITSCTNTSNPDAMIAAGLLARKARERGLSVAPTVKTSLAPGSRVVMDYLDRAGLTDGLAELGFGLVGFGCTTCVGNSGDLDPEIEAEIDANELTVASVLSGNRNFEGRIHGKVKANFLASPPLVVAYALAGTMLRDLASEPLGQDHDGADIYLSDIWPAPGEIEAVVTEAVDSTMFADRYAEVLGGDQEWESLETAQGARFLWTEGSSYLRRPTFFDLDPPFAADAPLLAEARPLLFLGDSITTDHISPVGAIAHDSPAADLLREGGVVERDFNAYGARRGNHDVMTRGTFANVRLQNRLSERRGGFTRIMPEGKDTTVFAASEAYAARGTQTLVVAGQMYGAGSARDWAAKGTRLLGVRCVLAESFERIHRSNLVRMGVLPLQFSPSTTLNDLGLDGSEIFEIATTANELAPLKELAVTVTRVNGETVNVPVIARVDTLDELRYLRDGSILSSVAKRLLQA